MSAALDKLLFFRLIRILEFEESFEHQNTWINDVNSGV